MRRWVLVSLEAGGSYQATGSTGLFFKTQLDLTMTQVDST